MADEKEDLSLRSITKISEIIHSPVRLAIMIFLLPRPNSTFPELKNALNVTSGNLSSHITKLEKEGFIHVEKQFINSKPTTIVSITIAGQKAISDYAELLKSALDKVE